MTTILKPDMTWAQIVTSITPGSTERSQKSSQAQLRRKKLLLPRLPYAIQLKIYRFLYKPYTIKAEIGKTVYGPEIPSTIDCGDEKNQWHTRRLIFSGLPTTEDDAILRVCKKTRFIALIARNDAFDGTFQLWSIEPVDTVLKFCKRYLNDPKYSGLFARIKKMEFAQCTDLKTSLEAVFQTFPTLKGARVLIRGTDPHSSKCSLRRCEKALPTYTTDCVQFVQFFKEGLYDGAMRQLFLASIEEFRTCNADIRERLKRKVKVSLKCLCAVLIRDGSKVDRYLLVSLTRC